MQAGLREAGRTQTAHLRRIESAMRNPGHESRVTSFLTISKAGPPGHDLQTGPKNRYSFTSLRGAKSLLNRSGNLASEKYLRPLKRFSAQGR